MYKFQSQNQENWKRQSWINDFTSDVKLAKSLTEAYAEDVLEAVAEDFQPNLTAAIEDLRIRVGLTVKEANDVKKVAFAMFKEADGVAFNPASPSSPKGMGSDGMPILEKGGLVPGNVETDSPELEKISDEDTCHACGAKTMKKDEMGVTSTSCDACGAEKMESTSLNAPESVGAPMAAVSSSKDAIKVAKGMNPGFRAYLDKQKAEKEGKEPKDEKDSKGEDMEKKDMKKTEDKKEDKKAEAAFDRVEILRAVKAGQVLPMKRKYATHKEASSYIKKVQAWFQGADAPTVEGPVTSNDPKTLGYPKEMEYTKKPMEVPVGGDSRNWEQKWFEGAADQTKKVMGPSGTELAEKKELQRAKRLERLKAIGGK
jgi:hypothetical protein